MVKRMEEHKKRTGTTTLGIRCKDGVVLAADRKATAFYIDSRNEKKVHSINERMAITTAGAVGDLQFLVRMMRAEVSLYELVKGPMAVESAATLLSNILHSNRWFPYYAQLLLGGFDENAMLYSLDPYGGMVSGEKIFVTGSGGPLALGILQSEYREDMLSQDGVKLAIKCIRAARERDPYSGGIGMDVVVISKSGIKELSQVEIEKFK
jgi:proteasome beta subunit